MIDTLNQTPQAPLPDDIQSRIENAKNNITIMEAEYARLGKLSIELTAKINAQHAEVKSLEEVIASLSLKKESLITEVTDLGVKSAKVQSEIAERLAEVDSLRLEKEELIKVQNASLTELNERESQVKVHEDNINQREIDLIAKENAHLQKVEKLRQAIQ